MTNSLERRYQFQTTRMGVMETSNRQELVSEDWPQDFGGAETAIQLVHPMMLPNKTLQPAGVGARGSSNELQLLWLQG